MSSSYIPAGRNSSEEAIPLETVEFEDLSQLPPGHKFIERALTTDSYTAHDDDHLPRRSLSNYDRSRPATFSLDGKAIRRNNTSPGPHHTEDNGLEMRPINPFISSFSSAENREEMATPANISGPHAYGNSESLPTGRRRGYTLEDGSRPRLLNSVPEEGDSSDDSDAEYSQLKDAVHDMDFLKPPDTSYDESGGETSPETTPRRRGLRHYIRKEKKKKNMSKSARLAKYLRSWITTLFRLSLVTRCFFYWLPLAAALFIPLAIGAWVNPDAQIGQARIVWIFIWLEVVWGSLWVSRLFSSMLPHIYKFITGILVPPLKKYRSVLNALEIPFTLVFWALISLCTFMPIMTQRANAKSSDATSNWQKTINSILIGLLISSVVFSGERTIIHLISVSFHKTRFATRIKDNKTSIKSLADLLYVSCMPFPPFCPEFKEEDLQLQSGAFLKGKRGQSAGLAKKLASSHNLQKVFGKINHAFDNVGAALGKVARGKNLQSDEIRTWVNSVIADAMNSEVLAEVLAMRIWMALVLEGEEHLTIEDLVEVLGSDRKAEAEYIFQVLDIDGNGNLTSEEMVTAVVDICRERRSVYKSLKDIDSAIQKLHEVLLFIVAIIIIVVFVGLLLPSVSTIITTFGTTIIALSFVFSTTAQEITASCVFLFVKHPIDVGDRVNIELSGVSSAFFVKEISLLYTVFTRVLDETVVQAPNSILNTVWIDNLSRSGPMTYVFALTLGIPETNFKQVDDFTEIIEQYCRDNSRDFLPDPFISYTALPDLDRVTLTCAVTFRQNFSDGFLYAARRSRLIQFLGRTIYDLKISIPRRADTSTDPALPFHVASQGTAAAALPPITGQKGSNPFDPQDVTSEVFASQQQQQQQPTTTAYTPRRPAPQRARMGFGPPEHTFDDDLDLDEPPARQPSNATTGTSSAPTGLAPTFMASPIMEEDEEGFDNEKGEPSIAGGAGTLKRSGTQVSRALTMTSRASGVSRRMTTTGRRRRET